MREFTALSIGILCASASMAIPSTAAPPQTWAAIAIDGKGHWGYAYGKPNRASAQTGAIKGCGAPDCRIELVGQARCLAFVDSKVGGYWYGTGFAPTQEGALGTARRGCAARAPAGTCRDIKAGCS
jgi:hypothetical protein